MRYSDGEERVLFSVKVADVFRYNLVTQSLSTA